MKATLETVPKFRILFTREPGDTDTLPEELGAERQPDGGWHLWDNSEPFNGIVIPAEAVGHLVEILTEPESTRIARRVRESAQTARAIEPDPGFRIVAPGETIQMGDRWKFSGGDSYLVPDCVAGCPLSPHTSRIVLQRPIAPKPTIEPDPGYRRVISGEISRDGDLWKYPDGHTIPGTPGLVHCDQTCGAILQRLDPGALAPGHNPDGVTVEQVGIAEGWRLLTDTEVYEFDEQRVRPASWWDSDRTAWSTPDNGDAWWVYRAGTIRTKAAKLEVVS